MSRLFFAPTITLTIFLTSACGGDGSTTKDGNYETTKKMVVDILQTEDGKKALSEILNDENMKQQLVIESDTVKQSINEAFSSEQGSELWQRLFKDPTFVESFAKAMEKEHLELMKRLMGDAEYQKQMIELLQNPEMMQLMLALLKSQQFKEHLEETIQQTLNAPLFQAKMSEILLQAVEEESSKDESSSETENNEETSEDQANEQTNEN